MNHSIDGIKPQAYKTMTKKQEHKKVFFLSMALLLIILIVLPVWIIELHHHKPETSSTAISKMSQLRNIQHSVNFPLYYPAQSPAGSKWAADSIGVQNSIVSFTYPYKNQHFVVIQQAYPPTIEQVTKTNEFKVGIGSAYIADLNGRIAGFIQTDKTLITISALVGQNADSLQQFMRSFQKLN